MENPNEKNKIKVIEINNINFNEEKEINLINVNIKKEKLKLEYKKIYISNFFLYFDDFITKNKYENLSKLICKNLKNFNINFQEIFQNLKILKILYNLFPINFNEQKNFKNLTDLYLNNLNLNNKTFINFFALLTQNNHIVQNLEILSLKNNELTCIDLYNESIKLNRLICFENMYELNFENNKIYYFSSKTLKIFPNTKILNLYNNNFSFSDNFLELYKYYKNKIVIFITGNIYFHIKSNRDFYIDYLNEILPNFNFHIPYLKLNYLYTKFEINKINLLQLNNKYIDCLYEINFSNCNITNEILIKLLNNNFSNCVNLKKIFFCNNLIDDNIFFELNKNEIYKQFKNLILIDFSGNSKITLNDVFNFIKFINNFISLKKLYLFQTNFEKYFLKFLDIKNYLIKKNIIRQISKNYEQLINALNEKKNLIIYISNIFMNSLNIEEIKTNLNYIFSVFEIIKFF
jgi:hypothetical protein